MKQREIVLWVDERWCHALEKYLPGGSVSEKLEKQLDTLIRQLPKEVYERIRQEIQREDEQVRQEQEAARRFSVFRVVEYGATTLFLLENHGNILYVAQRLREYLRRREGQPTRFTALFRGAVYITAEQFDSYVDERMDNTGRVTDAFDVDLDKGLFSVLQIAGDWKHYLAKDVSTAVYHAYKKHGRSFHQQMECFLERLADKGLSEEPDTKYMTGSRRLRPEEISFEEEVMECGDRLNFYVPVYFDPDAVFGTNVTTEENDDYINVYANYDLKANRMCPELEITLYRSGGSQEEYRYRLTNSECKALLPKMEAYCRQQTGMSLAEWAARNAEEAIEEESPQ